MLATAPYDIARVSEGVVFKGYLSTENGAQKETLLAQGACAIALGRFRQIPRVERALERAGEDGKHIFGGDVSGGRQAMLFVTALLTHGHAEKGDAYCLIQRRNETGCLFGDCPTSKKFYTYLSSYDDKGQMLGSAADACGGGLFRTIADCRPKTVAREDSTGAPAGLALCIETEIALAGGGDEISSFVVGYGAIPNYVNDQIGINGSTQSIGCADRGL